MRRVLFTYTKKYLLLFESPFENFIIQKMWNNRFSENSVFEDYQYF